MHTDLPTSGKEIDRQNPYFCWAGTAPLQKRQAVSDDDNRLSNLPAFTRQWILRKADVILGNKAVHEEPSASKGDMQWYSVGSFSSDKPHQVAVKEGGEVSCDCEGW
jgi:hypothetical protein